MVEQVDEKWMIRYFNVAKQIAGWSKDPSTKVGAVVIGNNGSIIAQGYNGFPRRVQDDEKMYLDREIKLRYIVHAEANCIYNACVTGRSLAGSRIFVHGLPVCNECAKGLIQVDVSEINCLIPRSNLIRSPHWMDVFIDSRNMLKQAKIPVRAWIEDPDGRYEPLRDEEGSSVQWTNTESST